MVGSFQEQPAHILCYPRPRQAVQLQTPIPASPTPSLPRDTPPYTVTSSIPHVTAQMFLTTHLGPIYTRHSHSPLQQQSC